MTITLILILAWSGTMFGFCLWQIHDLQKEVDDLRERLDVLDKPCE